MRKENILKICNTLWKLESEVEAHIGQLDEAKMRLLEASSFDPMEIINPLETELCSKAWNDIGSAIDNLNSALWHISRTKQSLEN